MRSNPFYAPDGMAGFGGDTDRFAGVRRDYASADVDRLAGSFRIRHALAERGAARLWHLLTTEPFVAALDVATGDQALERVRAGLKAICLSGRPVAGGERPPVGSVPKAVRAINEALRQFDEIAECDGDGTYRMAPVIADAAAGFGGPLNAYELMRNLVAAGAAGVQFQDQLASDKTCGRLGGKVLVPISQHIRTLNAARLAADVEGVNTVLLCRTDARSAQLLTSDADERDRPFIDVERTAEGFFRVKPGCGDEYAIARGLAYAPYADLLWRETSEPDLRAAERFANEINRQFPGKMLAYDCSASFRKLAADKIAAFQHEIAKMGYRFQFVTQAGFDGLNLSMFTSARESKERDMAAYNETQRADFGGGRDGYAASYFNPAAPQAHDYGIVHAHERHDDGLVHSHGWATSEAVAGSTRDRAAARGEGLMANGRWAVAEPSAGSVREYDPAHDWHDEGLVHNHEWAVSGN